nr:integrase, catalytic region, zinc finger, CCHC-type, peptidase aspartic, catalytic [Tanacetum cinerariifolium]
GGEAVSWVSGGGGAVKVGGKNGQGVEQYMLFKRGRDDYCVGFGGFTQLFKTYDGTVRFRNDHFGAIMGYEDYVISDSVISRVYYVEGLGHNLFSVEQFCDFDLEVAFRKHSCYV